MSRFKQILSIYLTFVKLGAACFGGGYAVLPLLQREAVEVKGWVEKEKIVDIFAVSQALPGAIALNASAFVGFSVAGIPGAIAALLGNLTPSLIIMTILTILFSAFGSNVYIQKAFLGIRPVIVCLVFYAAFKIGKTAWKDIYCYVIAGIVIVLALVFRVPVIYLIFAGIVTGLLLWAYKIIFAIKDKLMEQGVDK